MSFIGKWLAVVAVVFVKLLWDLAYTVSEGFGANSGVKIAAAVQIR